jgi:hypothetical protein
MITFRIAGASYDVIIEENCINDEVKTQKYEFKSF